MKTRMEKYYDTEETASDGKIRCHERGWKVCFRGEHQSQQS